MRRMHNASATWLIETSSVALLAAKESAISGIPLKLVMNGVAYPFVTCSDIPSKPEKTKNKAMRFVLNSLNASRPNDSASV